MYTPNFQYYGTDSFTYECSAQLSDEQQENVYNSERGISECVDDSDCGPEYWCHSGWNGTDYGARYCAPLIYGDGNDIRTMRYCWIHTCGLCDIGCGVHLRPSHGPNAPDGGFNCDQGIGEDDCSA